ncbi:28504_t:CDS:2, partial [Gigaspora margarita]
VYDAQKILFKSIISKVDQINIKETWQITNKQSGNNQRKYFVIVLDSISYMCICMSNISCDILYRHYFQVMLVLQISGFHIGIVASRWYCNSKKKKIDQEDVIFTNSNTSEAQQGQKACLILQPFIVSCSIAINNRSAVARCSKYGKIWGLAQQAHLLIQNEEPKDSETSKASEDSKDSEKKNNPTIENLLIT